MGSLRPHMVRRRLGVLWRRQPLRVAVAVAVLAAILALDSFLIAPFFDPRIDGQPKDVQEINHGEELRLTELLPADRRLVHDAGDGLYVALGFPEARLSAELMAAWSRQGLELPADPLQAIEYTFGGPEVASAEAAKPCSTTVLLTPEGVGDAALTLRLDQQLEKLAVRGMVPLRLIPVGGDLHVQVDDSAEGCRRLLRIGDDFEHKEPLQLTVTVAAGQSIEMAFQHPGGGDVEPFDLDPPLYVRQLDVLSPSSTPLQVRSSAEAPSIRVRTLKVAAKDLKVTYSGEGFARGPRAPTGTPPFARLRQGMFAYPLWAGFLSLIHAALFKWLWTTLRGPSRR